MKRASVSFEATGVQPVERDANGLNAVFDQGVPDRVVGVQWILPSVRNRFCAHFSTSSCIRSLASEFGPGRSAFADAAAQLVACVVSGASSAFGGAIAESRSATDDFKLVCQQLLAKQ